MAAKFCKQSLHFVEDFVTNNLVWPVAYIDVKAEFLGNPELLLVRQKKG